MKNKSAFLLNYPSHYRSAIYKKINNELDADFYFGQIPESNIKKLDYNELSNFKKEFKTIKIGPFFWYIGSLKLLFKPYSNYVLTGDPHILSNWFFLIFARIFNKKTFLWTQGWYGKEKGINKILKRNYFKLANHLLLYNEYSKNLLLKQGFKEYEMTTIYNSLNYEEQLKIRAFLKKKAMYEEQFNNTNPTLLFIGRVQKRKKINLILQSMSLLNKLNFPVNLVVIGKEEKGYDFNKEVEDLNLSSQVWVYGPCYDEEINAELIYNADLCVSPGNIGLAAIHCLMFGLPILTHDNFPNQGSEFEVIVDGVTGSFFNENDVEDLSNKIKFILKKQIKPEQCYKIIDEKWNPNNQIRILREVLSSGSL